MTGRPLTTGEAPVAYSAQSEERTVPVGYKLTEVGVIPEDWKLKRLVTIAQIRSGIAKNSNNSIAHPVSVHYLRVANVQDGFLDLSDMSKILVNRSDVERYSVLPGDMLMNEGGDLDKLGRGALWYGEFSPCIHQNHVFVVRCGLSLSPQFLNFLTASVSARKYFMVAGKQTTNLASINKTALGQLPVPIPPLAEQQAIAEALSDVDGLLGGLEKLIAKKRAIKTGAMQQLLTGKTRLPGFGKGQGYKQTEVGEIPEDWKVARLKAISSINGRIGWQGLKQEEFTFNDSEPFLITGMNFKDGKIRWDEVYHIQGGRYEEARNIQLEKGDILMTKDGTIGKLLYIESIPFPGKASLNSHLLVFRPISESYVPKFLFYQLSAKQFADYIELNKSGSTFFGITQEAAGNYNAYLPLIKEQQAIAKVLSDMDQEIEALETRLVKTKSLKQGMMQELLTGKTRLV